VADEAGPVYRASKVSRGAAWLVLASAAGGSIYVRVPAETVREELERYWKAHRR